MPWNVHSMGSTLRALLNYVTRSPPSCLRTDHYQAPQRLRHREVRRRLLSSFWPPRLIGERPPTSMAPETDLTRLHRPRICEAHHTNNPGDRPRPGPLRDASHLPLLLRSIAKGCIHLLQRQSAAQVPHQSAIGLVGAPVSPA